MGIVVVIGTVVAVVVLCVVLARQGSVGRLSEEDGSPDRRADDPNGPDGLGQGSAQQWSTVQERPADPGAESMDPDAASGPRTPG